MKKSRIILVDDHRILLDAIRALVEPEFDVVATYGSAQELLDGVGELKPDVVVLDIGLPSMNGLVAAERLKAVVPKTRIVFLTMNPDLDTAAEAFRIGARGYILKSAAGTELIAALREVLRGGYYASPVLTEGMTGSFVQAFKNMPPPRHLTTRQKEVLQLLREGRSMKDVAAVLQITPRTVAFHKYTIMEEFGISSNADLMRFADSVLPAM